MRPHHLLSVFFVSAILSLILFSPSCTAAFVCSNNITLDSRGMSWDYEEYITGREAIFFRELIDRGNGNNDSFVNAWEILKTEVQLRKTLEESIEKKPDVKLNGSSKAVKVRDVEFWLSDEALGTVSERTPITNTARVSYLFEERNPGSETSIWLMGTPTSEVTIALPPGFDANRTEGFEEKSTEFEGGRKVLKGNFGSEGEITLYLSVNESVEAAAPKDDLNESEEVGNGTLPIEEPENREPKEPESAAGFFENLLRRLCLNPKT